MLVVADILPAIQRSTGQNNQSVLYEYLNRAIQVLSKIQPEDATYPCWDPSLIYVDLPVQNAPGNLVILPYEIDRPIKVNVNNQPGFSRSRLFEFTLNGPGSSATESGWQFQDRGTIPVQSFINFASTLSIVSSAGASDAGVEISAVITIQDITGLSSSGFIEQAVVWTLGAGGTLTTGQIVQDIRAVYIAQPVVGTITLTTTANSQLIASYPAGMTKPEYAVIKISQPGYSVRILARRKNWKVALPTDWIPLSDQMAVIVATQFIKFLEELNYDLAPTALAMATQLLQNDQAVKMSFAAVAAAAEIQTPLNLDIIARDVIQVNDIYDEFCGIMGQVGQLKIFDAITEACEGLSNESHWDPLIGYVDILVQNLFGCYVTLPRDVDAVLAYNVNGRPGNFRNRWFEFNLDGLGEAEFYQQGSLVQIPNMAKRPDSGYDDAGEVVLAFDPIVPGLLLAWPFSSSDTNAVITVYGDDVNGNPLGGAPNIGYQVPCTQNYSAALGGPLVAHVTRITKQVTNSYIGLLQTDGVQNIQTLGSYWPDDQEPRYRRIKLQLGPMQQQPVRCRMMYRKRWLKISSLTDVLPLKARSALTMYMRYLVQIKSGQGVTAFGMPAENMRQAAVDLANRDWRSHNPAVTLTMQIDTHTYGSKFNTVY